MTTDLKKDKIYKDFLDTNGRLQKEGLVLPCPRCGYRPMNPKLMLNALSRHADVYICESCGMEEAMMDAAHQPPLPFADWAIFQTGFLHGKSCDASNAKPPAQDTFLSAVPDIRDAQWVKQCYALGLMLEQECPDNDCMIYKNIFNMARELDGAIEIVSGYPATVLQTRLHERIRELREMWINNCAILAYRAQHYDALHRQ